MDLLTDLLLAVVLFVGGTYAAAKGGLLLLAWAVRAAGRSWPALRTWRGMVIAWPLAIWLAVCCVMQAWELRRIAEHRRAVPERILLGSVVLHEEDAFGECGGVVFRLPDKAVWDIRRRGLAYFRGATGHRARSGPDYDEWAATPMGPPHAERFDRALACMAGDRSSPRYGELSAIRQRPGAYYTALDTGPGYFMGVLVVPDSGLVVYGFLIS